MRWVPSLETESAKSTPLVRPLEGFPQLAPELIPHNQPGPADSLLAQFFADGTDLDAVVGMQLLSILSRNPSPWPRPAGAEWLLLLKLAHDLLRTVADAALLVHQARTGSGCHLRVWYRRHISHRRSLRWASAEVTHRGGRSTATVCTSWSWPAYQRDRGLGGGAALDAVQPGDGEPLAVLWLLSPLVGWLLNLRPRAEQKQLLPPERDLRLLRQVARRTWRYPDLSALIHLGFPPTLPGLPSGRLAMRTVHTTSVSGCSARLSAHHFGYTTWIRS